MSADTKNSYPFATRWRLEGILKTRTPLHIGSGITTTRARDEAENQAEIDEMLTSDDAEDRVKIDAVPIDCDGHAYLPGTALKGTLRSWLKRRSSSPLIDSLFGWENVDRKEAKAGKAEFWDAAIIMDDQHVLPAEPAAPLWDPDRATAVAAAVAIHRRTRTAEHGKLFHQEFVPPEIYFKVIIVGQDWTNEEVDMLLHALAGFYDDNDPVTLGARTHDGWGRLCWKLTRVSKMDQKATVNWWQSGATMIGYDAFPQFDHELSAPFATVNHRAAITVKIRLRFSDGFLVRDHGEPEETFPLQSADGRILLPARSVRGALRSQTERIMRTLDPSESKGLIEAIFGKTEHRAALEFTDFFPAADEPAVTIQPREFVAIDRFTGGSAETFKFDARVALQPVLEGDITLNLTRLHSAGGDILQAIGLLALLMRDLCEGDITFGYGAAKGFGHCLATIKSVKVSGLDTIDSDVQKDLRDAGLPTTDVDFQKKLSADHLGEFDKFVNACLAALRSTRRQPIPETGKQ